MIFYSKYNKYFLKEIKDIILLDILAHWDVQMHKQQYKHPLDTILNNIQETQDKLLVVFFHGRGELLKKNIRYIINKSIQKKNGTMQLGRASIAQNWKVIDQRILC